MSKTGRDAIAAAFIAAYEQAANTGGKLAEVCTLARTTYKGKEVPEDDAEHIANTIADARDWEGATRKVRCSEVRKVLQVYPVLPEAIATVREKSGGCNWRDALKLATCLKKHDSKLRPALAAFNDGGGTAKATPAGATAGALKRWYKIAKGDKREKILQAASLLGLKLGIKLDA
jgi:hypothetical protein